MSFLVPYCTVLLCYFQLFIQTRCNDAILGKRIKMIQSSYLESMSALTVSFSLPFENFDKLYLCTHKNLCTQFEIRKMKSIVPKFWSKFSKTHSNNQDNEEIWTKMACKLTLLTFSNGLQLSDVAKDIFGNVDAFIFWKNYIHSKEKY